MPTGLVKGSESNDVFVGYQPQYPVYKVILTLILMGFKRFLALHATHLAYSVVEEIVEGFVEDCLDRVRRSADDFKKLLNHSIL